MKVEVREKDKNQVIRNYPYIGKNGNQSLIFFTEEKTGFCIRAGEYSTNHIGQYSNDWAEHRCEYYTGEVVLSND